MQTKLHKIFYGGLFVIVIISVFFAISSFLDSFQQAWLWYAKIYFVLVLLDMWYVFISLFWLDKRAEKWPSYKGELISVILPFYNERAKNLERAVHSIMKAEGNKELILIDDGSHKYLMRLIEKLKKQYGSQIKFCQFNKNRGKRQALYHAVKNKIKGEFVVTVDSDTILDPQALINLVGPLKKPDIGGVTGEVRLINEEQNMLTRIIASYYWVALKIGRKAEGAFGNVSCCSGALAGYRRELLHEVIDEFIEQKFLGDSCTYGEDRHLTNLVLKKGYRVIFLDEALAFTETPSTWRQFLKQQIRWKRSFVRESTYALSFAWPKRKLLFINMLRDVIFIYATTALKIVSLVILLTEPFYFVAVVLPIWILFMVIKNIFMLFYARHNLTGLLFYTIFNEFIFSWQYIYALFTVRKKGWVTR